MKLKLDMHVHTRYSSDGFLSCKQVIKAVNKKRLNGIAVTDHNEIKGALELKELASFEVIVGEEIKTAEGEIIGYFLCRKIPPDLSLDQTIEEIRMQGGLVCVPHPSDRFRRSRLKYSSLKRILHKIDMIETFNARNLISNDNEKATKLAIDSNLFKTAGSDAHLASEIGNAYIEIEPFSDKEDFLKKLAKARCFGSKTPFFIHGITIGVNIWNRKYF